MRDYFALACLILTCASPLLADDFASFRGGDGVAPSQAIPLEWSTNRNVAWKITVPGSGWSQPLVVGDRLYVTAAVSEKEMKPKNFAQGVRTPQSMGMGFLQRAPKVNIQWKVFCYSTQDGSELWSTVVDEGKPKYPVHPSNTYATESPAADSNGVYVYFGATGKVAGLSTSGEKIWERDIGAFKTSSNFGTGSSTAIHAGKFFVQNLSQGSADIFCLDTKSGETVWKDTREQKGTSWTSPFVWKNKDRVELIVASDSQMDGYNPDNGARLWTLKNVKAASTATPAADQEHLYFGASDPFSKGNLFALKAGGEGDLSPEKKNKQFTQCAWLQKSAAPGMASPVAAANHVYVADKNILRCYDAATGERIYQSRVPKIDMIASSPVVIGDKLLLLDENGAASLVSTGDEFAVVGSGKLEDGFWATPAVANGSIYLRGVEYLYCIRNGQ